MSQKILTVSIAAYNMEKYIRETLDSLIVPEVLDKLEVFVVDDGGKDHTLDIAREYAEKYPDVFIPVHKENGGYGSTVNYSLEHANGKYFRLLDGDDWINSKNFAAFVHLLETVDTEAVITPFYKGRDQNDLHLENLAFPVWDQVIDIADLPTRVPFGMWSLAFRTDILRASGLKLPEHCLYTDGIFSTVPLYDSKKVFISGIPVYCYRIFRDGQSTEKASRIRHVRESEEVAVILTSYYEENKSRTSGNFHSVRTARYCQTVIKTLMLDEITQENCEKIKAFDEKIRGISPKIYSAMGEHYTMGKIISLFRISGYRAYRLLKLLPGGVQNWY